MWLICIFVFAYLESGLDRVVCRPVLIDPGTTEDGGDNDGRVSGLPVVRGRQSPPTWTRKVSGEAGENGQSSGAVIDRQARMRQSVTSGRLVLSTGWGDRYRLGHRPVGSHMAVSPVRPPRPARCTVRRQ